MGGTEYGHGPAEPCEVEDPKTGQRYLMFTLPAWPGRPLLVYECPACCERIPAERWSGQCPGCAGKSKSKSKKRRRRR